MPMVARDRPLGCAGLLRVAALPIRYWLAGANPALFSTIERLDHQERERHAWGIQLAERIGRELVPDPTLSREDRAVLLSLRRALHRGDLPVSVSRERMLAIPARLNSGAELLEEIVATLDRDEQLARLAAEVATACEREEERLLRLPARIYAESAVSRALFASNAAEEFERQAHLSHKQRRHHFEHAWQRLTRAATGSTPRGWLSHVALLQVDGAVSSPPTLTDRFSAQWTANVRRRRLELSDPPAGWPHDDSLLAINPLHWDLAEHLVVVVLTQTGEQEQVTVRRTPLLEAILSTFTGATCTFSTLASALACRSEDERAALREFVRHLVVLGILQPSAPPELQLERAALPGASFAHLSNDTDAPDGWVDVYRSAETGISQRVAQDVQRGVTQALHLLELMRHAEGEQAPWSVLESGRSWTFTEILRAELDASDRTVSARAELAATGDEPLPAASDSGFSRLVAAIAEQAGHQNEFVIDLERWSPDGTGAKELGWPVDGLVRLPWQATDYTAVLDQIWPPGILDARFAETLVDLHGVVPQLDAYRAFLRELETLTGVLFVELLVPPLSDGAANAVRRPLYTRAWTGDPDAATYLPRGREPARYIPLRAIRIRRIDGRLRADVDGQPIWPVHHATRTFSPPWDRLARVLLATAPITLPWDYQRMIHALTHSLALPRAPRILVDGGVVISPAQWRLPLDELWERSAPMPAKLRALIRLRRRFALPRWVQLLSDNGKPPVPCDLESTQAIQLIERQAKNGAVLRLSEMLPPPDQFSVRDGAHRPDDRLAAQLHLRFPCDESALTMATRIAPTIRAALDLTSAPHRTTAVRARGRDPPPAARHRSAAFQRFDDQRWTDRKG